MIKRFRFLLIVACIIALTGCSSTRNVPETTDCLIQSEATCAPVPDENQPAEESWTKEEIVSQFSKWKQSEWEYIDCVLIPDHASRRIGAVLFWDSLNKTSNAAFFNEEGIPAECGVYAKATSEPNFAYLGNGAVSFDAETEDGILCHYTITLSVQGDAVNFTVASALPAAQ